MPALETRILVVNDLFSADYVFRFPKYQRPYRWTEREAEQLFDDLLQASRGVTGDADGRSVFLGSVVLAKAEKSRDTFVIDGRQRLTTLAIILAILRDLETDTTSRRDLGLLLQDEASPMLQRQAGARLQPDGKDGEILRRWVLEDGASKKTFEDDECPPRLENLRAVIDHLRGRIAVLKDADYARFRNFVVGHCEIVAVISQDVEKAYRIFQVLNARGMQLSEVDLIKPSLIDALPDDKRDWGAEVYDAADLIVGEEDMKVLIDAAYFMRNKKFPSTSKQESRQIDKDVKKILLIAGTGPAAVKFTQLIERFAPRLAQVRAHEPEEHKVILQSLDRLTWQLEDWIPVALALQDAALDATLKLKHFRSLERMCYSFMLLNDTEWNGRDARLTRLANALVECLDKGQDPSANREALGLDDSHRRRIREALLAPINYVPKRAAIVRRVEACMSKRDVVPNLDKATVLQVLPTRSYHNSGWATHFNRNNQRTYANMIGNCVLMPAEFPFARGANSFKARKDAIFSTHTRHFHLTKAIRDKGEWTPQVIEERTKTMVELLAQEWEL